MSGRPMQYRCEMCGKPVPVQDVHRETGIGLCAKCRKLIADGELDRAQRFVNILTAVLIIILVAIALTGVGLVLSIPATMWVFKTLIMGSRNDPVGTYRRYKKVKRVLTVIVLIVVAWFLIIFLNAVWSSFVAYFF